MAIGFEYTSKEWKQEPKDNIRNCLKEYFEELIEDKEQINNILEYVEIHDVDKGIIHALSDIEVYYSPMGRELIEIALGTWFHTYRMHELTRKPLETSQDTEEL